MSNDKAKKAQAVIERLLGDVGPRINMTTVRDEIERQLEARIIDEVEAGIARDALRMGIKEELTVLGVSVDEIRKLAGIPEGGLSRLEKDFKSVGLTPIPPIPPIPSMPRGYSTVSYTGYGIDAFSDEHELVPNPNESYREPSKIHFNNLLDKAGLDFRRVVEVYSRGYDSHTTLAEQKELIDSLNEGQNDVKFVLIQWKRRKTWWERLFRLRAKKDTIKNGPCGCYPCNCELFCHKLSSPEKKR